MKLKHWFLSVLLVSASALAQTTHQQHPPLIKGSDNPEKISDQRAWLMELIASTSSPADTDRVKYSAALHRRTIPVDDATLSIFRTSFDSLRSTYNAKLSDGKAGTTPSDMENHQQFVQDIEDLLNETIATVRNSMSQPEWEAVDKHFQESKKKINFVDDTQTAEATLSSAVYHSGRGSLVRTQSYITQAYASSGYTDFVALDTDGSRWYQMVHLYGSSAGPWTCEWNSYSSRYEPPGCPASHDFYTTNLINGQGLAGRFDQSITNPLTYVAITDEFDVPVGRNDGSETAQTGAAVICTVVGYLMPWSATQLMLNIRFGRTYEKWNGSMGTAAGRPTCNVYAVCANGRPYVVDIPYVILFGAFNNTCSPGFTCFGVCVRAAPGYPWSCTDTNPSASGCFKLWEGVPNPPQGCTPHP